MVWDRGRWAENLPKAGTPSPRPSAKPLGGRSGFPGWHQARSYTREASEEKRSGEESGLPRKGYGRGSRGATAGGAQCGFAGLEEARLSAGRRARPGPKRGAHTPTSLRPEWQHRGRISDPGCSGSSPVPRVSPLFPTARRRSADLGLASASEGSSQGSQVGGSQLSALPGAGQAGSLEPPTLKPGV